MDTKQGKQMLIDSFINKIYLYDDYVLITCNYIDGTEKITLDDVENCDFDNEGQKENKSEEKCSDLLKSGSPKGTRTPVFAVRGRRLNRLTMRPFSLCLIIISHKFTICKQKFDF